MNVLEHLNRKAEGRKQEDAGEQTFHRLQGIFMENVLDNQRGKAIRCGWPMLAEKPFLMRSNWDSQSVRKSVMERSCLFAEDAQAGFWWATFTGC